MNFYIDSNEACLYLSPQNSCQLIKIYKPHVKDIKKTSELKFLKDYQSTGYVPLLYSDDQHLRDDNSIIMEYLKDYITLDGIKKMEVFNSSTFKELLAKELIKSRKAIGEDVLYTDLHKKNVLINISNNIPRIKFIDPGESRLYYGAWKEWCTDIARQLNIVKFMKKSYSTTI